MISYPGQDLSAAGATFADALADILRQVIAMAFGATARSAPDRTTRIRAEAAEPACLVSDLITQVARIGDDFDASVTSVAIDGFRPIAEGVRAWGSVGLSSDRRENLATINVLGQPEVAHDERGWSIRAHIALSREL